MQLPRFGHDVSADHVAAAVRECGAAAVERFVPADEVAALKAELAPFRDTTPSGRNDFEGFGTRRIYALFAKVRGFDHLAIDPLVLGVLDQVLGPHYQLSGPVGIDIGPGESPQGLHQDDLVYPLPFPHPPVVLNTMWALDDFTEENGATRVVLGSHDTSSQDRPDPRAAVTATMPAGSVLFYVGTIWHEGGANRTDERRLGVILEYVRLVAAGAGDAPPRRAARARPHPPAATAGAPRLQHLPALPRLRRRPPPASNARERVVAPPADKRVPRTHARALFHILCGRREDHVAVSGVAEPVGRKSEREVLETQLTRARQGMSAVLVVHGEAGMGKTTLLDAVLRSASDMTVAHIAGIDSEQAFGFAALHRLLLPHLDLAERLPDRQRASLEVRVRNGPGRSVRALPRGARHHHTARRDRRRTAVAGHRRRRPVDRYASRSKC